MIFTDDEKFGRMLEALKPSLGDEVILGGWAHALRQKPDRTYRVVGLPVAPPGIERAIPRAYRSCIGHA